MCARGVRASECWTGRSAAPLPSPRLCHWQAWCAYPKSAALNFRQQQQSRLWGTDLPDVLNVQLAQGSTQIRAGP